MKKWREDDERGAFHLREKERVANYTSNYSQED